MSMSTSQPAPLLFPAVISAVPRSEWISEQFGWMPGGFGILSIAGFCETLIRPAFAEDVSRSLDWPWLSLGVLRVVSVVFGALLLTWEFRRRARRTVLVRRNGMVGIYHNLNLIEAISPRQIQPYILSRGRTRVMVLAAISPLVLLIAGIMDNDVGPRSILFALAIFNMFSSLSFTRIRLIHRIITTRGPIIRRVLFKEANRNISTEMFDQYVMLKKVDAHRIGVSH